MRNIILVCAFALMYSSSNAQVMNIANDNTDYSALWNDVDAALKKNLPQSASDILYEIDSLAMANGNTLQQIKVKIYQTAADKSFKPDYLKSSIESFELALNDAQFPYKNIYYSLMAELYDAYYQINSFAISNNVTLNDVSSDIDSWSRENFIDKIGNYYLKSLDNETQLKKIPLNECKDLLIADTQYFHLRPTLFDLLCDRAIKFFSSPVNAPLEISYLSSEALLPYDEFLKSDINGEVSDSQYAVEVLKLYRKLMILNEKNLDVFAYLDLSRLEFAKSVTNTEDSDELYVNALNSLVEKVEKSHSVTDVYFELASFYHDKNMMCNSDSSSAYYNSLKESVALCEKAVALFPEANGARKCNNLLVNLKQPSVETVSFMNDVYPDEHFTMLVNYRNCDNLYCKVVEVEYDKYFFGDKYKINDEDKIDLLLANDVVNSWSISLTNVHDYNEHSMEIVLNPLKLGTYAVLISNSPDFDYKKGTVATCFLQVVDFNVIASRNNDNDFELYVVDRNSGKAISKAKVNIYDRKYNNGDYEYKLMHSLKTDSDGFCRIPDNYIDKSNSSSVFVEIEHGVKWFANNDISLYKVSKNDSRKAKPIASYYLDRAIYRPGQIVHFKGILTVADDNLYDIVPNKDVVVELKDVNYQLVSSLRLKTNEFGSFAGSFVIPENCLTGSFTISSNFNGYSVFEVEEYKRPTFELKFENMVSQPKPNENIRLKVNAASYSGMPMDNAVVKYRITRESCFWRYWFRSPSLPVDILSGVITTDENGDAVIEFDAKCPSLNDDIQRDMYRFKVYVDVTSKTGESISDMFNIMVSEKSLAIFADVDDNIVNMSDTINIWAENVDNEKVDSDLKVELTKLVAPKKVYRERMWDNPDYYMLGDKEYENFLKFDYRGNNDVSNWERQTNSTVSLSSNVFVPEELDLSAGYYCMKASTKDLYGKEISEKFFFQIVEDDEYVFDFSGLKVIADKAEVHANENLHVSVFSSSKKALVRVRISSPTRVFYDDCVKISDVLSLDIPVDEKDRGGITIYAAAAFDGRNFSATEFVDVPFCNKKLELKLATERSVLLPKDTEKWTISISNPVGENEDVELLATMYDMSLDQFVSSDYVLPYWGSVKDNNIITSANRNYYCSTTYGFTAFRGNYKKIDDVVCPDFDWHDALMSFNNYRLMNTKYSSLESIPTGAVVEEVETDEYQLVAEENTVVDEVKAEKSIRRDFKETAFFYPQLKTDAQGNVAFEFVVPESITKWKFRAVAHSKNLASGLIEQEFVTKRDLYIVANNPKLLYQNDEILYTSNVFNESDSQLDCKVSIKILDNNNIDITAEMVGDNVKNIVVEPNSSEVVSWKLDIPDNVWALLITSSVETDKLYDAEEHLVPVLSDKTIVVETLPLTLKEKGMHSFEFDAFDDKFDNDDIQTKSYTIEYSANPAWYVVQTLPYLQSESDIVDVIFADLYSNLIASHIVENNPDIKDIYLKLKSSDKDALSSKLEVNQEVKSILLEETPWVLDAMSEQQLFEKMAMLFDENNMKYNISSAIDKLRGEQKSDGGFPWIKSGRYSSRFVTTNIVNGFAHLVDLGIINVKEDREIANILKNAMKFLDNEMLDIYDDLNSNQALDKYVATESVVEYLYAKCILSDMLPNNSSEMNVMVDYFIDNVANNWQNKSLSMQSKIALIMNNVDKNNIVRNILKSFNERALHSEELGMYWRDLNKGNQYDMYNNPVIAMASMIECYVKLADDKEAVSEMKRWLVNQKRTTMWNTSVSTVEAVYAMLLGGDVNVFGVHNNDRITVGNQKVDMTKALPGSGYVKQSWTEREIDGSFGKVVVDKEEDGTAWASVYWKYLADYDDVSASSSGLSVEKTILKVNRVDGKEVYSELKPNSILNGDDKVIVRLKITADRDVEFVHLKDVVPACFIPKETLSGYCYSDDLFYYQSAKDESMNFYIERMNAGSYIIDYDVNIQQAGRFNAGISTIQSYYAPEFAGHSEGMEIVVE